MRIYTITNQDTQEFFDIKNSLKLLANARQQDCIHVYENTPNGKLSFVELISITPNNMKYLLENGASLAECCYHPIYWSIYKNKFDFFKVFYNHLSNSEKKNLTSIFLNRSLLLECYEICEFLIEQGADINANNGYLLNYSVLIENEKMFSYLIKKGADVKIGNNRVLYTAIQIKNIKFIRKLIDLGCNFNSIRKNIVVDKRLRAILKEEGIL